MDVATDVRIEREAGRELAVTRFEADLETMTEQMGTAFGTVAAHLGRLGTPPTGPAVAYYDVRPDGMTVSAGFVVAAHVPGDGTVEPMRLPACEVARTEHVGPYSDLPQAYAALRSGALAHGRRLDESRMWEEYLDGPDTPPDRIRTLVSWPLVEATRQ